MPQTVFASESITDSEQVEQIHASEVITLLEDPECVDGFLWWRINYESIDLWTEELVAGGRTELGNFLVLETQTINRGKQGGSLTGGKAPRIIQQVILRASKKLKMLLKVNNLGRGKGA